MILFGDQGAGLQRIPASGGTPSPVTQLNKEAGETSHYWPQFLPGGKKFLYLTRSGDAEKSGVFIGAFDGKPATRIAQTGFKAAYDAANFVFCGYCPMEGWNRTKAHTVHLHIKDWIHGEKHGCLAGRGQGQWQKVIDEATQTGYKGFATMEPHFRGGGPTGGYTGPDLFPLAIDAFRTILDRAGAAWN